MAKVVGIYTYDHRRFAVGIDSGSNSLLANELQLILTTPAFPRSCCRMSTGGAGELQL
jgi:hypothetical protein